MIKHLNYATIDREAVFRNFFKSLGLNEVFTYSDSYLLPQIRDIANEYDVQIEYCEPGTEEYSKHGCCTCKVTKPAYMNTTLLAVLKSIDNHIELYKDEEQNRKSVNSYIEAHDANTKVGILKHLKISLTQQFKE